MKGAWPVEAHAVGGRHYRGDSLDQNFDTYSVQYAFPDGTRLFFDGRNMAGCRDEFASYAHGSKGSAVISTLAHTPGMTRIYKGQKMPRVNTSKDLPLPPDANLAWAFPQPEKTPYQWEWDDLMDAIRQDKPYNEVKRGAEASLVASMGRMAAHTGQIVTFDQMLNCPHEFAPDVDKLTMDGPPPLRLGAGRQVSGARAGHQEGPRILTVRWSQSCETACVAYRSSASQRPPRQPGRRVRRPSPPSGWASTT